MAQAAVGSVEGQPGTGEQLEVTAPVDGVVIRVLAESEGVVQTGQPLLEIGDARALEIVVDVLSADAVAIEPGAAVRVDGWGGDATLEGRVRRVEPGAFSRLSALGVEEQRVNVVIDFTSPPSEWQRLGDGFRVEAHIVLWREDSVLKVPSSALFRRDGAWALYRVRDDQAELVVVEVGRNNGLEAEIVGGLEAGDRVVVHPGESIADGVALAPRGNPS
jgi:HlyD family secretion protein